MSAVSESIPASVRDTLARAMASLPISIKNFLTGCKADVPYMTFTEDLYVPLWPVCACFVAAFGPVGAWVRVV